MTRRKLATRVALPMAVGAVLCGSGIAVAASQHGITGTAYENGDIYISSTNRYKSGAGTISVTFTSLPKNGLYFEVISKSYGSVGNPWTPQSWTKSETNLSRPLAKNVNSGTQFENAFSLNNSCNAEFGCKPYDFVGSETY